MGLSLDHHYHTSLSLDHHYHTFLSLDHHYHTSLSLDHHYHTSLSLDHHYHTSLSLDHCCSEGREDAVRGFCGRKLHEISEIGRVLSDLDHLKTTDNEIFRLSFLARLGSNLMI